jgi:ABC-2 type transport system ATP-binding protein
VDASLPGVSGAATAIRLESLFARDGRRAVLHGIDLEVRAGERFGIMGPNGAGKTTVFRVLATRMRPASGHVRVAGHDVTESPLEVRRRIGVVFQGNAQDPLLTVEENLALAGRLQGLHGRVAHERRDAVLREFDLNERRHERAATLSGGLRRRLELARALLHQPPVLLLDEPSAGLDPAARAELWAHLGTLGASGVTVFVATHDLDEAERCDRVAVFDRGRCAGIGSPEDLRATIGGEVIVLECDEPAGLASELRARFTLPATVVGGELRIEVERAHEWVARLYDAWPGRIRSLTVRPPTLEDVFVRLTGHRMLATGASEEDHG